MCVRNTIHCLPCSDSLVTSLLHMSAVEWIVCAVVHWGSYLANALLRSTC